MRNYSMRSHKRRNHQRWLNSFCRKFNKSIADDPLWKGRFVVEQVGTEMEWFEDNSGGILHCLLRLRDKKTGITKLMPANCLDVDWKMWHGMNDFIINTCKVWENEDPYKDRKDYRNEG